MRLLLHKPQRQLFKRRTICKINFLTIHLGTRENTGKCVTFVTTSVCSWFQSQENRHIRTRIYKKNAGIRGINANPRGHQRLRDLVHALSARVLTFQEFYGLDLGRQLSLCGWLV